MSEPQRIIVEKRRVGGLGCGGFLLILFVIGGLQSGWDKITGNDDASKDRKAARQQLIDEAHEDDVIARREANIMDRFRASKRAADWRVERVEIDGTGLPSSPGSAVPAGRSRRASSLACAAT